MATKTISIDLDAYERLRKARRTPDESFSRVIEPAHWHEAPPARSRRRTVPARCRAGRVRRRVHQQPASGGAAGPRSAHAAPIDTETALIDSGLTREPRQAGRLIGTNDLWIAASSMRHQLPLVTASTSHFDRVDGLTVPAYRHGPSEPAVTRPPDGG